MKKIGSNDYPRISRTEYSILKMLINHGRPDLYGLQMIKISDEKLKRGTIYTTLTRMEDKGLISSRKEEEVQPGLTTQRRMYRITGLGQKALHGWESDMNGLMAGSFV